MFHVGFAGQRSFSCVDTRDPSRRIKSGNHTLPCKNLHVIYFLSGVVLVSPLLAVFILTSRLSTSAKVWILATYVVLLVVLPIAVFFYYGAGGASGIGPGELAVLGYGSSP